MPEKKQGRELSGTALAKVISVRAEEFELHGFEARRLADFLSNLKRAVISNDRSAVAELVNYPLLATVEQDSFTIHDSREFLKAYERVLTPRVISEIQNATMCNVAAIDQSVTIGGDIVWIKNLGDFGMGIVTVNVPEGKAKLSGAGKCSGDAVIEGVGCIPECR